MRAAEFDVIVVGAGVVGASLAHILAGEDFSVAVLEKADLVSGWDENGYDLRVSAINLGAERMLKAMDVWNDIKAKRVCHYERMFVWDAGSGGHIEFDSAQLGLPHLGSIVENNLILLGLHQRLSGSGKVEFFQGVELARIEQSRGGVLAHITGQQPLRGKVLVGADGPGSSVRQLLDMDGETRSFGQSAIVAQVGTELDHQNTAWQRFLPTGPLAFLPLSNGDSSIVWSCEQDTADELMSLSEADFSVRLTEAFERRLGNTVLAGPRRSFPLATAHADSYVQERSVLVGDAAHVVHPLAGQGVNLGLADAATLAEVLIDSRGNRKDIGSRRALRRFERWRKGDNLIMLNAMVGLNRLFGSDLAVLTRLRGGGLDIVDSMGPVKGLLAVKAMGLKGDLPALMRGGAFGVGP